MPKNYFPAVEKGLQELRRAGPVLAGYPVVGLTRNACMDGSYHPVDSSEMAFKTAATLAYKAGMPQAQPGAAGAHWHPAAPRFRTRTWATSWAKSTSAAAVCWAWSPLAPASRRLRQRSRWQRCTTSATFVRQVTQGRGSYTFDFTRYEEAPAQVAQKVIEQAKAGAE